MTDDEVEAHLYDWENRLTLQRQLLDVPYYLSRIRHPGVKIAVLGCGTGRVAVPLADAGFHVTGIDLSIARLRLAQLRARELREGSDLKLLHADMREVFGREEFDFVIIPYSAFLLLPTRQDRAQVLRNVHDALCIRGEAIIDTSPNFALRPESKQVVVLTGYSEALDAEISCSEAVAQRDGVTVLSRRFELEGAEHRRIVSVQEEWHTIHPSHMFAHCAAAMLRVKDVHCDYSGATVGNFENCNSSREPHAKHIYLLERSTIQ